MPVVNGYLTVEQLRASVDDDGSDHQADYERAINAASRQVDDWCSTKERRRHFWREDTPTARLFTPNRRRQLRVGDFADTTGMVVKTDDNSDGVLETTWTADQWQPEPLVRVNGWPYTEVAAVADAREFPLYDLHTGRARVEVTARWGWAAVPPEVEQATQILATAYYKARHLTGNQIGFEELSTGLGPVALARDLVAHLHVDGPRPTTSGAAPGGG